MRFREKEQENGIEEEKRGEKRREEEKSGREEEKKRTGKLLPEKEWPNMPLFHKTMIEMRMK